MKKRFHLFTTRYPGLHIIVSFCSRLDGNIYKTILIGSQVWMAENLKTTKYHNGILIGITTPATFDIHSKTSPKYQWVYGGDENNVATYDRLYTWYAVTDDKFLCPTGLACAH
jgi:uncharacterized protein (TIGR02145 family)